MHRLFTATAVIVSAALISISSDAAGAGGGPHVKVFDGRPAASDKNHKQWSDIQSVAKPAAAAADDGHKDWINLNKVTMIRWAPGVESRNVKVRGRIPAPGSGLPTGKRQHRPFTVIKPVDRASPLLARAAKTGRAMIGVVLIMPGPDGRPHAIKLKPVYITSYGSGGSAGDTPPTETMSLNFER